MKEIFKSLAFVCLAGLTITSCKKEDDNVTIDPCINIECGTYGTCNEGTCLCEAYYETNAEGKCEVLQRAKFLSNSYAVTEACGTSTADYSATITAGTALNEIRISNFWELFTNAVVATVSGNTLTISAQEPDNDGYNVVGSGYIEGTIVTINVTITDDNGNVATCTFTYTK